MSGRWLAGGCLSLALCLSGCGYVVRIPYANMPSFRQSPAYTQLIQPTPAPSASPSAPIHKRSRRR